MRLGFTGTRDFDPAFYDAIGLVVDCYAAEADEFTTGACYGFDAWVARRLLTKYPERRHRLVVPQNRSQVDTDLFHEFLTHTGGFSTIELMPEGTDYRARNNRILDHTDFLLGVAAYEESHGKSRRSGTWMTKRLAEARSIPYFVTPLHAF